MGSTLRPCTKVDLDYFEEPTENPVRRVKWSLRLRMMWSVMETGKLKITNPATATLNVLRLSVVGALLLLVSACVTTGGKQTEFKKQTVKQSCAATQDGQAQQPGSVVQGNCLPKGVIEISESFGVDPQIREEFNHAIALLNSEDYPQAIRLLKGVTGKTSKFSAPYINLGIAYARTGEMEKAEESLKKALEINARHPVASNELGLVYRKTGRYDEARNLYEALLAMYPDFLPARKNLGVLCDIYIQDLNCALEQYEEYLKGKPDDEKVQIWVADVKSRM